MPLMLPHAPQFSRYESNLDATPALASGTSVTHYGTAHTKNPTYTELIAATSFDACLVIVTVSGNNAGNADSSTLLDIAIGAATEESVIIPDLMAGWVVAMNVAGGARNYIFPLYVPSGSRLSGRTQSVLTTGGVNVVVQLYGSPRNPEAWWCGQTVTCYGANAATSAGTKFTLGSSGSEGTAVSVGTTTKDHECLVLGVQGHPDDTSLSASYAHLDVGIDASSTSWLSEDMYWLYTTAGETMGYPGTLWWPIFAPIPSGTSIVVGGESSTIGDSLSAAIYGIS